MRVGLVVALAAMLILWTGSCGSSGNNAGANRVVLDQFFDPLAGPTLTTPITTTSQAAQTFTVDVTGTLAFVELFVSQTLLGSSLTIDIRPTVGGVPVELDALALGSLVIPDGGVGAAPGFFTFDFRPLGIAVTTGQVLAVTVRATAGTGTYGWSGATPGGYVDGDAYTRTGAGLWTVDASTDFLFRTFVTVP